MIVPIMGFAGNAAEAMDLYVRAFGAKVTVKVLYSQANAKDFVAAEGEEDLIYYAEIKIGRQTIALGDNAEAVKSGAVAMSGNAFVMDLLVHFKTDEELRMAHEVMAEGGEVTAPLCSQTYCSLTCALVDRFGGRWQFMSGYKG